MTERLRVAVTDYVFPSLEPEKKILRAIGAELLAGQCRSEEIISLVAEADAILNPQVFEQGQRKSKK